VGYGLIDAYAACMMANCIVTNFQNHKHLQNDTTVIYRIINVENITVPN